MQDGPGAPHVHTARCLDEDCQLIGIPVEAMPQPRHLVSRRALLLGSGAVVVAGAFGLLLHRKDTPAPDAAPASASPTPTTKALTDASPPLATAPAQGPGESAESVEVPKVVGLDLQTAQERLRRLGFRTESVDATGQGRAQVVDSNWLVVRQDPPAGFRGRAFQKIAMYVKKVNE